MSLWFVVPAKGRFDLSRACLRLLAGTCETLTDNGIEASAVVIADDENLDVARELGFATVEQANEPLGRKFNDGIQLATDPAFNPRPADYYVPFGSDNWIDPELILSSPLPTKSQVVCFQRIAIVSENARRVALLNTRESTGYGIRIIPAGVYRPADEDRERMVDLSILTGIRKKQGPVRIVNHDLHPVQIVDWKTSDNLHTYESQARWQPKSAVDFTDDLFADVYPSWAVRECAMQTVGV